jgi:peptide methionine sulfoxide reductase msrA/msrB
MFFIGLQSAMSAGQENAQGESILETATFAGGCFWCMEKPFEQMPGVKSVVSGYTGGTSTAPTYKTYAEQGHLEAVRIQYNPQVITYSQLLDVFWHQVDPTDPDGQFVDRGRAYSTAIFYHNESQKKAAEESKDILEKKKVFAKRIVTPILPATPFYPAEDYHQDYYRKNPLRYKLYRFGSGRDKFLDTIWGKKH